MFDNIGEKIKDVTRVFCVLGMIICIIGGIILIIDYSKTSYRYREGSEIAMGFGLLILGPLFCWIGSLVTYGFGELISLTQNNNNLLQENNRMLNLGMKKDIDETTESMRAEEEEQRRKEREAEQERIRKQEEAERIQKEKLEKEKQEKAERFEKYWSEHTSEKEALLKKKEEAASKLKELGVLAGKEKSQLEDLIKAIDEELTKER